MKSNRQGGGDAHSAAKADKETTRRAALKRIAAASVAGGLAARISAAADGAPEAIPNSAPIAVSVGESAAWFDAADATLPHGGVRSSNTGQENDEALDELFRRMRASKADRKHVEMPAGTIPLGGTCSPSGKEPGKGERAAYLSIHFPNTRLLAVGAPDRFMPLQLPGEGDKYYDMDHFANARPGAPAPWSKSLDTVWIQNDERGSLRKMRAFFNCRNCEALHIGGMLTLDCGGIPDLVGLSSTGGYGISGMKQGVVDILHIENAAVGIMGGNFAGGAKSFADNFTNSTFGVLQIKNGNKVGFVGHSNHFDCMTIGKLVLACPHNSYISGTHNIVIGSGFINVPSNSVGHRALVLMGTNMRINCIYFHSGRSQGPAPSDAHILLCDNAVLDINYHNDINAPTSTGCHLAMGKAPSGANCRSASLTARVDIRSANSVRQPKETGNPGMLWMDTEGGAACRRQVELYMASQRADYDLVKIGGKGSTNDKITLYDVRDDKTYGKTFRISQGALALWA